MMPVYERVPISGPLSDFVHSFHHADAAVDIARVQSPPTGYPLLTYVWRGDPVAEISGQLVSFNPLPALYFGGQLEHTGTVVTWTGGIGHVVVEFTATGLYELFGVRGRDIVNRGLPVALVAADFSSRVMEELAGQTELNGRLDAIVSGLETRLHLIQPVKPFLREAIALIEDSRGMARISNVAQTVGISERYLSKYFREIVGVSPKFFAKTVQINWVSEAILSGKIGSLAELSQDAGFHDQAHFAKEVRKRLLMTPYDFIRSRADNLAIFIRLQRWEIH